MHNQEMHDGAAHPERELQVASTPEFPNVRSRNEGYPGTNPTASCGPPDAYDHLPAHLVFQHFGTKWDKNKMFHLSHASQSATCIGLSRTPVPKTLSPVVAAVAAAVIRLISQSFASLRTVSQASSQWLSFVFGDAARIHEHP